MYDAGSLHELGYPNAVGLLSRGIQNSAQRNGVQVKRPELLAQLIINGVYGLFMQHDMVRGVAASEIEVQGHTVVEMLMQSRDTC